jgi:hypothetical protein
LEYSKRPIASGEEGLLRRETAQVENRRKSAWAVEPFQQLAAVRRLAHEAADSGLLSPELAAGISRVKGRIAQLE